MTDPKTQNPSTVHLDECRRIADLTVQWKLEDDADHPVTAHNELDVLICGEEAFKRIAQDIEKAKDSIDIVCWGFDPGMELERGAEEKAWPRGQPFGSLLHAAAGRGVRVRLLVWHDKMASAIQNNMPGYTGDQRKGYKVQSVTTSSEDLTVSSLGMISPPPIVLGGQDWRRPEQQRHDYCVGWWRDVMAQEKKGDDPWRIQLRLRGGGSAAQVRASLTRLDSPEDPLSSAAPSHGGLVDEKSLIEDYATHHQKTVLIDYAWEDGGNAIGYVMGLNSLTDYWDSQEHEFDTPLREVDWGRKSDTAQALPVGRAVSRDPYQDYACRIQGPALRGIQCNFVKAWERAGGKLRPDDADREPPMLKSVASPGSRIQIVRTQPQEGADKSLKSLYWQAASFARNYIYIENQYFYYERWVRHLKAMRAAFMKGVQESGASQQEGKLVHLIAVIPWPEDDGMVPRTYDTLKSLGEAQSMPNQDKAMDDDAKRWERWEKLPEAQRMDPDYAPMWDPLAASARMVQAPVKNDEGELEGLGLKVLLARLITQNHKRPMPKQEQNYRQVYIHSKLMLIDDAMFTLGSANLNVRSMAADSELNMVTDDHKEAAALRQKVWELLAGGFNDSNGRAGGPVAIRKAFKDWQDVMKLNQQIIDSHAQTPIHGFVIPFKDERKVNFRHG